MPGYQVDWIGAVGAGIAALIAFLIARYFFKATSGVAFYVAFGAITFVLALGLRFVLKAVGV